MLYCMKCREIYDLPFNSLEGCGDPEWDPQRRYCPKRACSGYVHDIDTDMIPIIDMISDGLEMADSRTEFPFIGVTLHSCSGHWYDEVRDVYPSTPYLVIAVLPRGITGHDMEYFATPEHRREYYQSMSEYLRGGKYPEYANISVSPATVIWDNFDDIHGETHNPDEGWIPITIGLDTRWVAENFPGFGRYAYPVDKIDAMRRHARYLDMFIEVLKAVKARLISLWDERLPEKT